MLWFMKQLIIKSYQKWLSDYYVFVLLCWDKESGLKPVANRSWKCVETNGSFPDLLINNQTFVND